MDATPRLSLPLLSAGQAQKELFHNEALQTLDLLVGGAVEGSPMAEPPSAPTIGSAYIVGAGATGSWAGKSQCVAAFTSGGWRFVEPSEGLTLYVRSQDVSATFRGGNWDLGEVRGSAVVIGGQQVVGSRAGSIASPAGGSVVDAEARAIVGQILETMRGHGLIAP